MSNTAWALLSAFCSGLVAGLSLARLYFEKCADAEDLAHLLAKAKIREEYRAKLPELRASKWPAP